MFKEDDEVMITCKEISDKEELACVVLKTYFGAYEVNMLMDHKPGTIFDPIRTFDKEQMRFATEEEIVNCIKEWEEKHNYKLT